MFSPPCDEAVTGAGVRPAVRDGGIDFKNCLAIIAGSILREYYGGHIILDNFQNGARVSLRAWGREFLDSCFRRNDEWL